MFLAIYTYHHSPFYNLFLLLHVKCPRRQPVHPPTLLEKLKQTREVGRRRRRPAFPQRPRRPHHHQLALDTSVDMSVDTSVDTIRHERMRRFAVLGGNVHQ